MTTQAKADTLESLNEGIRQVEATGHVLAHDIGRTLRHAAKLLEGERSERAERDAKLAGIIRRLGYLGTAEKREILAILDGGK